MKKLITVLAAIGALALASSASADEMTTLATPGMVRVTGDFTIPASECALNAFFLTLVVVAPALFVRVPAAGTMGDGFSFSEKEPGVSSLDVTLSSCLLEFTLRLNDANMELDVGDMVTVRATFWNDLGDSLFDQGMTLEIPEELSADL